MRTRDYNGGDFSKHVYPIGYEYDLNGRRSALSYPTQLTTTAGGTFNRVRYQYDAASGALASVTDLQNNPFTFAYDAQTRVDSIVLPGSIVRKFGYDGASRLINDFVFNRDSTTLGHFADTRLRETSLAYNSRGDLRLTANVAGKLDTLWARYTGLGHLDSTFYSEHGRTAGGTDIRGTSAERFRRDALGNDTVAVTATANAVSKPFETTVGRRDTRYQPGTGRQVRIEHFDQRGRFRTDSLLYDASGNVALSWTIGLLSGTVVTRDDRAMFYAADGRLRVVDHRTATVGGPTGADIPITLDFDEHRYDALGRRVMTRTQRACVFVIDHVPCAVSTIRRSVWDDAQEIMEIQQPGHTGTADPALENDTAFSARLPLHQPGTVNADINAYYGRVAYTFGPELDQPLSVTRWAYQADSSGQLAQWPEPFTIVPHWNTRGEADEGAFDDGATRRCGSTVASRCVRIAWPYGWTAYRQKFFEPAAWHGSLLEQKRDGSGLLFRRNRYLDPATGKFTQEDPIGLAGGVNLYGFAAGNPVNYSDPFGLDCRFPATGEKCPFDPQRASQRSKATFDVVMKAAQLLFLGGSGNACEGSTINGQPLTCLGAPGWGPPGGGARPPLRVLHDEKTLVKGTLDYFRKQTTEQIIRSLEPGAVEPLIVNARGTVMQGNHRISVLMERGVDVNSLPRTPHP